MRRLQDPLCGRRRRRTLHDPHLPAAWLRRAKPRLHGRDGRLRGLDPSDAVAEYADSKGQRRIAISNRVFLCVPRYVLTRGEMAPSSDAAQVVFELRALLEAATRDMRDEPPAVIVMRTRRAIDRALVTWSVA